MRPDRAQASEPSRPRVTTTTDAPAASQRSATDVEGVVRVQPREVLVARLHHVGQGHEPLDVAVTASRSGVIDGRTFGSSVTMLVGRRRPSSSSTSAAPGPSTAAIDPV